MKSIDRLAMELVGKSEEKAMAHLERHGFSIAESSEIVWQFVTKDCRYIVTSWVDVAKVIKSTMACSVRIGDRLNMDL